MRTGNAKLRQNEARNESRAVESHAATRQDSMAGCDETRTEIPNGVKLGKVRQVFVEDRKVNVQILIRNSGDADIDFTFEIDDSIDPAVEQSVPVVHLIYRRRNKKLSGIVYLKKFHCTAPISEPAPQAAR